MKKELSMILLKDEQYEAFKAWVENTNLFHTIKEGTNKVDAPGLSRSFTIVGHDPPLIFTIDTSVKINRMEDLPEDMIKEFYINSPFNNYGKTEDIT